jgi:RNA polymerase sigma-70 factor, ECF subfamily
MERSLDRDHPLVAACQDACRLGGEGPFRALHDRHKDLVHRICLRITGDAGEALDAAQDAFLLAFRGIRGFRFRSRFERWLGRIAAHASFERMRRLRPVGKLEEQDGRETECPRHVDPLTRLERRERRARIRRALDRLSPHQRQILVLRYFEQLSYEELASRLGIARGSVCSRLHRAHAALGERVRVLVEGELETPRMAADAATRDGADRRRP